MTWETCDDVDAAGGDVGRHQDLEPAGPEAFEGRLTPVLREVPLQGGRSVAGFFQLQPKALGAMLGAGEDQDRLGIGVLKQLQEQLRLEVLGDRVEGMADRGRRGDRVHLDGDRVASTSWASLRISVGMVAEKSKVCRLAGQMPENAPDVGEKAHVEHLVGLVEHQHLQPARSMVPCRIWSRSRPGQATTISTPRFSFCTCGLTPTPP